MSFIQVPIKQGIGITQPPIVKTRPQSIQSSSIQYLESLAEDSRIIFREGSLVAQGTIVSITPETGTSFYFLGASLCNQDPTDEQFFTIINNGIVRQNIIVGADDTKYSTIPMDRIVGDGVGSYQIDIENNVDSFATMWGYILNTVRIS